MTKHLAYFEMTYELLSNLLSLPHGTKIVDVKEGNALFPDSFMILVENPEFPESERGKELPLVQPSFRRIIQEAVEFEDWNLE